MARPAPKKRRNDAKPSPALASEPVYFPKPAAFRAWLEAHHATEKELLVGYHRRATGKPSMTWPESVDEALCFGWIDGVRRRVDDERYTIRFTPRKAKSTWSAVNVRRYSELEAQGLVKAAGKAAWARRVDAGSGGYSYEQMRSAKLPKEAEARFRGEEEAWAFFQAQAPWYRRAAVHWVMSAKREETRERRLGVLIEASEAERAVKVLARPDRKR